jgi:hypothetical protein
MLLIHSDHEKEPLGIFLITRVTVCHARGRQGGTQKWDIPCPAISAARRRCPQRQAAAAAKTC